MVEAETELTERERANRERAKQDPVDAQEEGVVGGWGGSCGIAEVLALAIPLMISTASWTLMQVTDRVFLLWHSKAEMAAAMPAGMLLFTLQSFPLGVLSYLNTFVAQYDGAERPDEIGRVMGQGLWIAAIFTVPALALIPFAPTLFLLAGHGAEMAGREAIYFQILSYGVPAGYLAQTYSTFYTGRGHVMLVMCVNIGAALLNIVLDYVWIFGYFGFPEGGIAGAAWATITAEWAKAITFAICLYASPDNRPFELWKGLNWDSHLIGRIFYFGGTNGLNMFTEVGAFTIFLLVMGQLGEEAVGATSIAFQVNSMAFMPVIGMGIAVSTLVGRELGSERPDRAERATWNALIVAMIYSIPFAAAYFFLPDWFLMAHEAGVEASDFVATRDTVAVLLRFVAIYCLFDTMNVVFVSAIKGAGDMLFVLAATSVIGLTTMSTGVLGLTFWNFGLIECWWAITGWIVALGLAFLVRFLQGTWREMRVIEPKL